MLWILLGIFLIGVFGLVKLQSESLSTISFCCFIVGVIGLFLCFAVYVSSARGTLRFQEHQKTIDYLRTRPEPEQIGIGITIIEENAKRKKEIEDLDNLLWNSITSSRWEEIKPLE